MLLRSWNRNMNQPIFWRDYKNSNSALVDGGEGRLGAHDRLISILSCGAVACGSHLIWSYPIRYSANARSYRDLRPKWHRIGAIR